jgi:hypothetical protein
MTEYPIWRIPNSGYTIVGAADMFAAEFFEGARQVEEFNNEQLTFKVKDGVATYQIVVTDQWINVHRR